MYKKTSNFLSLTLLIFLFSFGFSYAQDPESRLKDMGIELRIPGTPTANFVLAVQVGNLVFLSGHGPVMSDGEFMKGKVGSEIEMEQAQEAARLTGISLLSSLKAEIGSLSRVKRIVKVLGMVN